MMNNWSALLESLSTIVGVCSIAILLIGTIWRFIKEKNYPRCYRMFDYLGCILFFVGPILGIVIGKWFGASGTISAGLAVMLWGIGGVCIGVSSKLLPESNDTHHDRKKYWKIYIGAGIFLILYSIEFILGSFWGWLP